MDTNRYSRAAVARWLVLTVLLVAAVPVQAQSPPGFTGRTWKVPQYDNQQRLRSVVSGAQVTDIGDSQLRIEQLRIDYFREDGALEFLAEAPECIFHVETRSVSSSGPLQARSADGRFLLTGRGFLAQQATASLLLSNDVRALIQTTTNALAGVLAPAPAPSTNAGPPLEITSATFAISLSNKTAQFQDNVRAVDPQFELTSGLLTARFAGTNGALDALEAERAVVLTGRADGSRVTAARALYTVTNDTAVLTGDPRFRQRGREGQADRVTFNRRTRELEADGAVRLRAPREEIGRSGFLLSAAGATNPPVIAGGNQATNHIEILCRHLLAQSNLTVLDGDVRLVDGTNRMTTGRLTLETQGTNTTPVRARAENGLLVEQGARRVKADRGVYERVGESITFYGRPEWTLEDMEGAADRLQVFPRTNAVVAGGDLRLKFHRLGGVDALLPVFTNVARTSAPAPAAARPDRPVEVRAEKLVVTNGVISLTGGVQGHELPKTGAESRFRAGQVLIELAPGGQRAERASAVGGVVVEQGTAGVTNGPAAYRRFEASEVDAGLSPLTGELVSFDARIGVRVEQPGGWAAGDRAYYSAATDTMILTNRPTASIGPVRLTQAEALHWHRGTGTIEVIGSNTFEVQPGGSMATNALPKLDFR